MSMPILPHGTPRAMGGGLLRSRSPAPARHGRSCGRGATARQPTTWRTGGLSVGNEISCPVAPDVKRTLPLRPRTARNPPFGSAWESMSLRTLVKKPAVCEVSFAQIVQSITRGIE